MKTRLNKIFVGILAAIYLSSMALPGVVFATPQQIGAVQSPPVNREPKRGINPETGKISFIGAGDPISVPGVSAINGMTPLNRAMGLVSAYAGEFGLNNPAQELKLLRSRKDGNGNDVVHYQQAYRGVPVIAGEMIVSMNAKGELLSISGEVSSNLTLDTNPTVTAREAEQIALTEIAKIHQMDEAQLTPSNSELWIFDESLLKASTRPVELVWRMEVTANGGLRPIREMVLVNAQTGDVSFHINQVDTEIAHHEVVQTVPGSQQAIPSAIPSQIEYDDLVVDGARSQLYGADRAGNKIDVINMSDLSVINSFPLTSGALPTSLDLSPDGNELAVAQSGLDRAAFVNLTNGTVSQMSAALSGSGTKVTDVIYGRSGILYALSNNGLHVINVTAAPHVEDPTQYVSAPEDSYYDAKFGVISSDKNTLYYMTGSDTSAYSSLNKYNVSNGLVKPALLSRTHLYNTGFMYPRLSLIDDSSLLISSGSVYNTSNLTPKARNGQGISPITAIPGKNFYVIGKNQTFGSDALYFFDKQSSYQVSILNTNVDGTPGAMAVTGDGNTLFVSSTGGMAKFTLGATPPGTPIALPQSMRQYRDFAFDMPRGVVYGTDTFNRIDVIDQSTGNVVNSYLLPNGANPIGIDLSPDGSELAVALNGLEKILFINPETGAKIAEVTPQLDDGIYYTNLPFDVIYGRTGRLYSEGNPDGAGIDYLHVINTSTHTWVAKSTYPDTLRTGIEFSITSDQRYLYANETLYNVYVFDVQTDTVTKSYQGPGTVDAPRFAIVPDGSKVFTTSGQVWSGDMQTQLGTLQGTPGTLIEYIPGKNAVVLTIDNAIRFIDANNYSLLSTYYLTNAKNITEMEVAPDGSKLIVNDAGGIIFILNLTTFPPPTPIVTSTPTAIPTFTPAPSSTPTLSPTPGPGPSRTPGPTSTAGPSPTAVPSSSTGNRRTYTASGSWTYPGTFLCDQSTAICTNGTDADADKAHRYAADTFVFYNTHHGRNSFDNQGGIIHSTVHFGVGYQNAFWDGYQMVYGDGMAADDVVGHEITHGVTQYASNLIYSYQSGAINESFSDVWGEFIDQTNGSGNDSVSVKWLIGEDTPLGAIRSMSDPTLFGDPDKMSSPYYYYGSGDNGGVHFNSGVNNKAAYLMVQGDTFNGRTITGIGLNKTAAVYYEAQANLLTAGSNYNDLYYALVQACQNLMGGSSGITQNDCNQVKTAAEAVEMVTVSPPTPTPTSTPGYNPLYISLTSSQTIAGVSSADEDILRFDGINWSLFFDGSDVGVSSTDLFAFSIVDADTILMSFNSAVTVNGIAATPQDVLRFDATSLGSNTAGTFSMYFNGVDVGFDNTTSEKIDSLSLLPDGRLLISTTGNPVVPGISTGKDEDVLTFTPTSLGDVTSGTWSMYFDGSDVGLSETSGEDVDALDMVALNIYLSTQGDFSVNGLSGADEDVFVCTLTSIGNVTTCDYSPALYFDGSTWGLAANDVDAFNFLAPGPTPTTVPTNSPTRTPTVTNTPTFTATAGTPNALTFTAAADARVSEASPITNYGSATTLLVDAGAGATETSYIRFAASGISGSIQNVKLRVFCTTNGTINGPAAYLAGNDWIESGTGGINWNMQPGLLSTAFDNKGAIGTSSWVEYDVTPLVTGNGTYTFALVADGSDGVTFSSREGATPPQLVVTLGAGGPTSTATATLTPTFTPTSTATMVGPSSTPTYTATATQTGNTFTFTPLADAYVNAGSPTSNYGSASTLRTDASPDVRSYLRFEVQGLSGTVTKATLRLYANSASSLGCTANSVSDNTWNESTINYNNAPPVGSALGSSGAFGAGVWIDIDVTAYITGNGIYNLALTTASSTAISFTSRETGDGPRLVIETAP